MGTSLMERSCEEFIGLLASKAPVPGGGGAAALVGALGMALGTMVGSLTVGKPKYADVETDISELMAKASALQQDFIALVAADAEVFEPLSRAYGLPQGTDEQAIHKAAVMEKCLRECCAVPLKIMEKCCEAIDLHEQFAAKGAAIVISDAGCGVIICKAALQAASLNVFINTRSMTDCTYAEYINKKARTLLDTYGYKADQVFLNVEGRFFA